MSLPRAYLAMKLTQPLPIRGGPVLRTVGEAANYVLELPQSQVEGCQRWRQAAQLLLDQAGVAEVSKQVKLALFYDAQTSRPWSRERSSLAIQGRVGRPSRRGRGPAFHPLHRLWRLDELPRSSADVPRTATAMRHTTLRSTPATPTAVRPGSRPKLARAAAANDQRRRTEGTSFCGAIST